jgi:ligand-binding SRPBCC domain-containing protein
MKLYRLERVQIIPASRPQVWDYFSRPENLNEITPPDLNFEIISGAGQTIFPGQLIQYRIQLFPIIKTPWLTEITHVHQPTLFVDEQRQGPYKFWQHQHRFREVEGGTEMTDLVSYQLPFGWVGQMIHCLMIKSRLQEIFDYREQVVAARFDLNI